MLSPIKKKNAGNKTDAYQINDSWSMDLFDLIEYGLKNYKSFRYILVVINNFSKIGWTTPLKTEIAQIIKESSGKILFSPKPKTKLI